MLSPPQTGKRAGPLPFWYRAGVTGRNKGGNSYATKLVGICTRNASGGMIMKQNKNPLHRWEIWK
jgi:hypothetical protein